MKNIVIPRFYVLTILFMVCSIWTWGQTEISFDISKGNVIFTNENYSGKSSDGSTISGSHNPQNKYTISGKTGKYKIQVGSDGNLVDKNFVIYLNGADIQISSASECAFSVWNRGSSVVAVILQNGSKNKLYSGKNRAGLEKSGGATADGTLVIACEEGYKAWKTDPRRGHTKEEHNESACTSDCGKLDAKSGNAWNGNSGSTYNSGAGIGTAGLGSEGTSEKGISQGTNALVNLTIAGGNIEARGAWGSSASSTSGGAAAIGTGSASDRDITAGTISGLNITGGNIKAYRVDNSAACIGGGYRSGYVTMNIYGGTIDATQTDPLTKNIQFKAIRAAAIGGGGGGTSTSSTAGATVTIYNGKIKAMGQYGAAIGSGSGGSSGFGQDAIVTIHNGNITATTNEGDGNGSGAAIGSGGSLGSGHAGNATITINGGKITATSKLGADIGGGGTNSTNKNGYGGESTVTISGGTINAETGGIGGGRANSGVGGNSTIAISGENTIITARSIGGGRSLGNIGGDVTLVVNGGKLTVTDFIGGGIGGQDNNNIGCASVNINGGDISGRILMRASKNKGCEFNMTGGKLTSAIADEPGGAVYMDDPDGVAKMEGGTIYDCKGTTGGAVYMSGGKFDISGGTISGCTGNTGGAVYLDGTGQFIVNGGIIQNNSASGDGGAFYLTDGTFAMTSGKIMANTSTTGNGAGIYINDGTVSLSGGEISGNIASVGKGGGFYVGGGTVTLSNGKIASNKANLAGGGICLEGKDANHKVTVAVRGCTLTANEATDGNGGGIFLSNAEMTYNGGMLTSNSATGTGQFTTGYKVDAETIKGVGGGIYISSNSKLSFGDFSTLGIYANSAENAADDIFANGNNTELLVPNITYMKLQDYAGNADGLGWYEDYFINDVSYGNTDIAKGEKGDNPFTERFKEAQEKGFDFMRLYDIKEESITLKNTYIAFALGFLFSDLTIRVEGLKPGETCIFSVQGTAESGKYKYQVPIFGTSNQYDEQKIIRLPIDKYTVTLNEGWSWAYDKNECEPNNGTITEKNSVNGGIYKFTMKHRETSITHDEKRIRESLE